MKHESIQELLDQVAALHRPPAIERRVGLVVIDNVGHYLLRDTPEDVARLLHRIGAGNFEGVTDDEGRPTGVLTKLRAVFARS